MTDGVIFIYHGGVTDLTAIENGHILPQAQVLTYIVACIGVPRSEHQVLQSGVDKNSEWPRFHGLIENSAIPELLRS